MSGLPTQVAWLSFMGLKRPLGTDRRTPPFWEASLQPQEAAAFEAAQTAPLGGRGEGMKEGGGRRENQGDPGGLMVLRGRHCGWLCSPQQMPPPRGKKSVRSATLGEPHHPSRLPQCGPCPRLQGRWEGLAVSPLTSASKVRAVTHQGHF